MLRRIVLLTAFAALEAHAHATLEVSEAPVNSHYKGTVRILHGCAGMATQTVRVQIPEGVIAVKPSPKPGWTLEKVSSDYAKPYSYYGQEVREGVSEIIWRGNLPDDEYDEFVFVGFLTTNLPVGEMFFFPTIQECEGAAEQWVEIPREGQQMHSLKNPAPGVKALPATGGH